NAFFHFMKIVQVFAGTPAAPDAQFIVLQMYADNQNQIDGHQMLFYDAAGNQIGTGVFFSGNVANAMSQDNILVGTAQASTFCNIPVDLTIPTGRISATGGKICFTTLLIDCVAWGNYTGSATDVGTPFNPAVGSGIPPGRAIVRRLDRGAPILDSADD